MSTVNSVLDDDNSNLSVSSSAASLAAGENREGFSTPGPTEFTMEPGLQQAMG